MPGDPIRIEIHVHHHLDGPIDVVLADARRRARGAVLQVKERSPMTTTSVTVDATNEVAQVVFIDDHGDTDAPTPAGATIEFTSSNPAAAMIAPDPVNPLVGLISVVGEGQTDIGVSITDSATGAAYPDWTPIDPVTLDVDPGAAIGARLALASEPATAGGDTGSGDTGTGGDGAGLPGAGSTPAQPGDGTAQPGDGTATPTI